MDISLNKFISEKGFCSRRDADKLIEEGRVTINELVAKKGNRVTPSDVVKVDGTTLDKRPDTVYLAFNKPPGITSTTDLKDKDNIISYINYAGRIFPVGRLDKDSEGLIFLTNDGDIVNKILRAGNEHEKEYTVRVEQRLQAGFVDKMSGGLVISGQLTKKCFVKQTGPKEFTIILTQGLNRQIRKMCAQLGYRVIKLKRVRIMNITLKNIPVGEWRHFTSTEMEEINQLLANSSKEAEVISSTDNDEQ